MLTVRRLISLVTLVGSSSLLATLAARDREQDEPRDDQQDDHGDDERQHFL